MRERMLRVSLSPNAGSGIFVVAGGVRFCDSGEGFFFSSRRRHTRLQGDWSSDVCSSDLEGQDGPLLRGSSAAGIEGPGPVSGAMPVQRLRVGPEESGEFVGIGQPGPLQAGDRKSVV